MKYLYLFIFLMSCSFLAAQNADSLNVQSQKEAVADTTKTKPKRTFNQLVVKTAIDSLILENRTMQPFIPLRNLIFIYNSGYHVAALPEQDIYMKDHGFTVRQTPFGLAYELQKRMAFSNYVIQGRSISFEETPYPYPAALATSEFGIGGQDMNYAHLSIRKNELVSVDSLYGRFDALFQRGIWGGVSDNSTLEDIFLKYAIKGGNLQLHANSLDWDIPAFQHELIYMESPNTTIIREKSELASLYWENKWLNVGIQMNHVNWIAPTMYFRGVHDFNQILLDKEIRFKPLSLQIRYEHFNGPDLYTRHNQFITPTDLNDLGTIIASYNSKRIDLNSTFYGANPKALGYDNVWQYKVFNNASVILNCVGMKAYNQSTQNVEYKNMEFNKTTLGIKVNHNDLSFQLDLGNVSKEDGYHIIWVKSVNQSDSYKTFYLDFIAHAPVSYHNWYAMINYKAEAPYFQSTLDVNAFYNLPYNNRILLGVSHTFRDKSYMEYGLKDIFGNGMLSPLVLSDNFENRDNLLDAYAGLQITKQFDIRFTVKNIADQQITFGTPLIPITYLLTVKWDFVN